MRTTISLHYQVTLVLLLLLQRTIAHLTLLRGMSASSGWLFLDYLTAVPFTAGMTFQLSQHCIEGQGLPPIAGATYELQAIFSDFFPGCLGVLSVPGVHCTGGFNARNEIL